MKFYIASSLKNIENVRRVADSLKSYGFIQTYDWTTHSNIDTISKLCKIGQEELTRVMNADVVIVMFPAGKGSHVELGIAMGAKKKILLYSSTHEINNIGTTCSFYHVDEVEQIIGTIDDLIDFACLYQASLK